MSAMKILATGILFVAIAGDLARGESIHSSTRTHDRAAERLIPSPTSLVYQTPTSQSFLAAENLAGNSASTNNNATVTNSGVPSSSSVGSLFLNTGGQNSATTSSPITVNWTNSPASTGMTSSPASASSPQADAFINFGSGPYPEASSLATGNASAFFNSPVFAHFFGSGGPAAGDIARFEQEVLSTIKTTYNNAGLAINLTADPNTPAAHTISVVSGASYSGASGAIGITDVGNNGFSFIDKFGGTQTVDQLATAVGHNISHELMHAFGIANHPEQTGPYVDAASSTLQTLSDPNTGFSQAAAKLLSTLDFQSVGQSVAASGAQMRVDGDQMLISPSPVPEPSTVALWVVAGGFVISARRRRAA